MKWLCGWLGVSRSGYYDWLKRSASARQRQDEQLIESISEIHERSRGTYGSPRVHVALKNQGHTVGRKRVERLMRSQGLQGRVTQVTRKAPGFKRFKQAGENLRLGGGAPEGLGQQWAADVTYLKTGQGWRYLAVVIDLYSRRVVGWSLQRTRTTDLSCTALRRALAQARPRSRAIFHTDRGIEYTAYRYQDMLERHGMRASLNRAGHCTDNAHVESFFHTLKAELIRGRRFATEGELRNALRSYINDFYNHQRLHSSIGYMPPAEYERMVA